MGYGLVVWVSGVKYCFGRVVFGRRIMEHSGV